MKKPSVWISISLAILVFLFYSIRLFGVVKGLIIGLTLITLAVSIFFGIHRFYRWKYDRLAQSILPGETFVTNGLVSDGVLQEIPAIMVCVSGNHYRIYLSNSKTAVSVQSVTPKLKNPLSQHDPKAYIEMYTIQGSMYFAPRKSFFITGQSTYAQEVLERMLAGIQIHSDHPNSA